MKTIHKMINYPTIRFLDHSTKEYIFNEPNNALASFAIDDAIAEIVGNGVAPPTMRMWVHDQTVVLGIPDSRLPYIDEGVKYLTSKGYHVVIRNSGGLAVLIDKGVLNMSLILPTQEHLSIHEGYNIMFQFIQHLFKDETNQIKAFEIEGSYCPGDYDLSVGGIKFAGISQRRVRKGVAIQIYIDIEGSSKQRASVVREFYKVSKQGVKTKYAYPSVNPNVMGSISELLNKPYTIHEVIQQVKKAIVTNFSLDILHPEEESIFKKRLEQMKKRNEKISILTK